jgi:long-chain acyl-CoA synthetase
VRMVAQTGSSCPIHVKRAMIDWFGPVFRESYGASESGIISFITSDEWLTKPGSVGRPQDPFEVLVLDDDGQLRPPGVSGRLYFRDATGRGIAYRNDPEKSAAAHIAPGVFTLGDFGFLDEDGYLYVTGRGSDMVISGGVNIYPAECERVLIAHDQVRDAAVFGVPDDEMGERLVGIARVEGDITGAELVAHCRDRIAHYKVPRDIRIVAEVPRTPMGKIVKEELAAAYARS